MYKRQALYDVGDCRIDTHELQADLQGLKYQNADQNTGNTADTTVGGNAADRTSCDCFQLIAEAGCGRSAACLCAQQEAAEAVQNSCEDVNADQSGRNRCV